MSHVENESTTGSETSNASETVAESVSETNRNPAQKRTHDETADCSSTSSDTDENGTKRARSNDNDNGDENETVTSKMVVSTLKNCIQLLHELTQIQPIKYETVSTEGPAHKPIFKYSVNFRINQRPVCFYVKANSIKSARKLVSLKGLNYLVKLGSFFKTGLLNDFYRRAVDYEIKSLNIDRTIIDDYSLENANLADAVDISSSADESVSNIDFSDNNQDIEQNSIEINLKKNKPNESEMIEESINVKKPDYDFKFLNLNDVKLREVISTNNPLSIVNHLMNGMVEFVESKTEMENGAEIGCKQFRVDLKVQKQLFFAKYAPGANTGDASCMDAAKLNIKESIYLRETESEFIFSGSGSSKKNAKHKAALISLELLFNIKHNNHQNVISTDANHHLKDLHIEKFQQFADRLHELVIGKYKQLLDLINTKNSANSANKNLIDLNELNYNKFLNVYAAVFQSNGLDLDSMKLVCFTTGTKCINGEYMSDSGKSLNDCHAEILAIRLLRKHIYKNLAEYVDFLAQNPNTTELDTNIFEKSPKFCDPDVSTRRAFKIKDNVNFHLYISSAPCGDGRIFSVTDSCVDQTVDFHPKRKVRGLLRAKVESGVGTIPVSNKHKIQLWDAVMLGERLKIMSCSDKLCKYNVTGIQGALLSNLIETVYLSSIIVGGFYHTKHMERAMYERITKDPSAQLPHNFKINKPVMSSVTNIVERKVSKPSNKSLMWSSELSDQIEIINCSYGKKIDDTESEICKFEMFKNWVDCVVKCARVNQELKQYLDVCLNKRNPSGSNEPTDTGSDQIKDVLRNMTYHEAKQLADDYQKSKMFVYNSFYEAGLGAWSTKPFEQNDFFLPISDSI